MSRVLFVFAGLMFLSQPAFAQAEVTTESNLIVSRGIGMMPGLQFGNLVKNSPVSARMTNRMVRELCDGNRIVHEQVTLLYRDASGRVRREHSSAGASSMIMISDPVEQQTWMLDETTRTAYKSQMFGRRVDAVQAAAATMMAQPLHETASGAGNIGTVDLAAALPSRPIVISVGGTGSGTGQTTVESLGPDTIDGVWVEGTAYTTTYPANMFGNELPIVVQKTTWYAPELQMMVRSEERDPRMGTVTYTTEILSVEEPEPALFEIPGDYKIIEPALARIMAPVQ